MQEPVCHIFLWEKKLNQFTNLITERETCVPNGSSELKISNDLNIRHPSLTQEFPSFFELQYYPQVYSCW